MVNGVLEGADMKLARLSVLSVFSLCLFVGCGEGTGAVADTAAGPEGFSLDTGFATLTECNRAQKEAIDDEGLPGYDPQGAGSGRCLLIFDRDGVDVGDDSAVSNLASTAKGANEVLCKWTFTRGISPSHDEQWLCRGPSPN